MLLLLKKPLACVLDFSLWVLRHKILFLSSLASSWYYEVFLWWVEKFPTLQEKYKNYDKLPIFFYTIFLQRYTLASPIRQCLDAFFVSALAQNYEIFKIWEEGEARKDQIR